MTSAEEAKEIVKTLTRAIYLECKAGREQRIRKLMISATEAKELAEFLERHKE